MKLSRVRWLAGGNSAFWIVKKKKSDEKQNKNMKRKTTLAGGNQSLWLVLIFGGGTGPRRSQLILGWGAVAHPSGWGRNATFIPFTWMQPLKWTCHVGHTGSLKRILFNQIRFNQTESISQDRQFSTALIDSTEMLWSWFRSYFNWSDSEHTWWN